ncbi:alpha-ketoglutaric semialdehyde dehydrogenase GucD [Terribacillus goriensis]|uniref:alpha-ketoglutaric semialdehyde dehydrogenase GucD n=1 Tax=Terribacillus saccharophilus TaxID=361277 RepID=UPI003983BC3E
MATNVTTNVYRNFINGEWQESESAEQITVINPADTSNPVGQIQSSTTVDLESAVEAADTARKEWRSLSGAARGEFLYRAAAILEERAEEIAETATKEMGKTLPEARGETQRGIAILKYYAAEGMRKTGDVIPSTDPGAFMYTTRVPLGVVGVIAPWNFPVAIPIWKMAPALIYGNTIVFKPASETAITAIKIIECFEAAGFPKGVINLVTGAGSVIGKGLAEHPKVNGITFTGSNNVGKGIGLTALERGAKYQLEMGGKNPVIVAADADIEQAVDATISGAFRSTGQKCTATSRVIVEEPIYEAFRDRLIEKTKEITIGNSLEQDVWLGPIASKAQLENCLHYIQKGMEEGAKLILGGEQLTDGDYGKGFYVQPTIFEDVTNDMVIAQEEIFGPVIALIKVDSEEKAIDVANDVKFGLSASIFTKNIGRFLQFVEDMEAGLVRVNAESAGVELQAPFGGMKQSSSHSREQGEAAKEFFTSIKTVLVKG